MKRSYCDVCNSQGAAPLVTIGDIGIDLCAGCRVQLSAPLPVQRDSTSFNKFLVKLFIESLKGDMDGDDQAE